MESPKKTPGEILAKIPKAKIDLTDEVADRVSVDGKYVTPAHAIMIGSGAVAGLERPKGVSAMVTREGGIVETTFNSDGKPESVTYTGPRRVA